MAAPGGGPTRIAVLANLGTATTTMYSALAARGHEVHLFTFHHDVLERTQTAADLDRLQLHFLPSAVKWHPIALARQVRPHLARLRPDVWHAHIAIPYGVGAAVTRWHPFLLTTHGSDVYFQAWVRKSPRLRPPAVHPPAWIAFRSIHAGLAAVVDRVIVYSPDMMDLLPRLGYPRSRLTPCFLGVDTSLFRPGDGGAAASSVFRIVCTRNLEPIYGHETLLRATALLRSRGVRVRLTLAGDGSERPRLEGLSSSQGLGDTVRFLGAVPHRELPRWISEADVLVSASHSDTTALSVLEGMACGLPVVVTDVGSLAFRIVPGRNGFLFRPGDVEGLAGHLGRIASDPELRHRIGEENRREVSAKYDLRATVRLLEGAYESNAGGA